MKKAWIQTWIQSLFGWEKIAPYTFADQVYMDSSETTTAKARLVRLGIYPKVPRLSLA